MDGTSAVSNRQCCCATPPAAEVHNCGRLDYSWDIFVRQAMKLSKTMKIQKNLILKLQSSS